MNLTIPEYEAVRDMSDEFAVAPSDEHVFLDVEDVVARHERYWVVKMLGEASGTATHLDRRETG